MQADGAGGSESGDRRDPHNDTVHVGERVYGA